jgi:nucleoside-diphosphate-sugar epimerase
MGHHVVIGAGPVGSSLAVLLAEKGHDVRVVTRSGRGPVHPGVRLVRADASDNQALAPHVAAAAAIYNCANPPSYQYWVSQWPPLAASLLRAAESSGAVLVTMSNLYAYGPVDAPMTRDHPLASASAKGRLRAAMWRDTLAAHESGRARVAEARASDYVGGGVPASHGLIVRYGEAALAGKTVYALGNPDAAHSWTFVPDVAQTLSVLGSDERAWGQAWHVPTNPPASVRQVVADLAGRVGRRAPKVRGIGRGWLRPFYPFSALLREVDEVMYQFERPFVVDAGVTTSTFGLQPTPWDDVMDDVVRGWKHRRDVAVSPKGGSRD